MTGDPPVPPSGGRRGHRRVVRPATGGPGPQDAGASGVGADDRDTGWGDGAASRPASRGASAGGDALRGPVSAEDEQYLRDRPPHWG